MTSPRWTSRCSVSSTARRNGLCASAQVDRQRERVVVALEVGGERVAGAGRARGRSGRCAGRRRPPRAARVTSSGSPSKAMRSTPRSPWTTSSGPSGVLQRRVDGVGEALLHGGGGQAVEELLGQGGHATALSQGSDGGGDALAGGLRRGAERRGDAVVVEVLDEAQPQRVLGGGRERGDQRLEGAVVVLGLDGGTGGSSVGISRRRRRCRSSAVVVVTRYSHARR